MAASMLVPIPVWVARTSTFSRRAPTSSMHVCHGTIPSVRV